MGTWFDITALRTSLALDPSRRAEAVFTVGNATDAPIRGEAVVQPAEGADASWFVVDRPQRSWGVGESDQVAVAVVVPADAPAGARAFRLRVQLIGGVPEEDFDTAPPVSFDVPPPIAPPPIPRKAFPWWIVALIVLVLVVVVAGGVFVATRPSATPTPTPSPTPSPTPTATPGLPNLVIDPDVVVSLVRDHRGPGEQVVISTRVTATIRNEGQSPAGPFIVVATIDTTSARQLVDGLAPGASTTLALSIDTTPRGGTVTVDATDTVRETNEGDNERAF